MMMSASLSLNPDMPLIISDADEVLLQFVRALGVFLDERELDLVLTNFALSGNILGRKSRQPISDGEVKRLIAAFFHEAADRLDPVDGAVDALKRLSARAQIIILSNVPAKAAAARVNAMRTLGFDYPLIANEGLKGPAVKTLTEDHRAPVFFLDDIPHNIASVAQAAPDVHLIHFVNDERLRPIVPPAPEAHARIDCWAEAEPYLWARL